MFGLSQWFQRIKNTAANDHGFDAAMLGLDRHNPYPLNSVDWQQWEWGYNDGMDTLHEHVTAHNISNEYESDGYGGWG